MERLEYNLSTGELKTIQLTQNEINAIVANQPPAPIRTIDTRRLKLALYRMGVLPDVKSAITNLGEEAQIEFDNAATIKENHPLVVLIVNSLNLNVDDLLKAANSIE